MNDQPPEPRWLSPEWPVPGVACGATNRLGGASAAPWDSFNTALHTGDDPDHVAVNRQQLQRRIGASALQFLDQVHGCAVVRADPGTAPTTPVADAVWTDTAGLALVIQTADCVPVLLCDRTGACVGAAHAGWRGLALGVIGALVHCLPAPPGRLLAWIGPSISGRHYEVGVEVLAALRQSVPGAVVDQAFAPGGRPDRGLLDLVQIARWQLSQAGLQPAAITGSGACTFADRSFFSYRRDGQTGRQANFIMRLM